MKTDTWTFAAALRRDNLHLVGKLVVVTALMFGFGYALVPLYRAICTALGVNVLSLSERAHAVRAEDVKNTQIDYSRSIEIEFDANSRGPWEFSPATKHLTVHPGELTTVMYEFRNVQNRTMSAQAIPSYAPKQATAHFNKLECFCFNEYTLQPGESKRWQVVFVIDPKLPKDVKTITLSYTFFEVAGKGVKKTAAVPPSSHSLKGSAS
ncbi:cytochrome c oxidase assembly protein [Roseateles oligotrophus]|uniref:Cytochrome c oxidase assembly protein CtaG n=1 Tax=Roseateles oligotrophus TaxID=1769250 RepID=A0ABT2YE21_9BURK|nr:cytochrome c oxidase assembly protein [Roseateles oligotrophus]MCV2368294.1 cytochrome c oxidase assembly protein [Roseateles oligotrophus]